MTSISDTRVSGINSGSKRKPVEDNASENPSITMMEEFSDPFHDILSFDERRTLSHGVGIGFKSATDTWLQKDEDGELSHSTERYIFLWDDVSKKTISKPLPNSLEPTLERRYRRRNEDNTLSPNLQEMLLPSGVDCLDVQFISLLASGTTFDKLETQFNYKGSQTRTQYYPVPGKEGKIDWISSPKVVKGNHIWIVKFFDLRTGRELRTKNGYGNYNSVVKNQTRYRIGENRNYGSGTQTTGSVQFNPYQSTQVTNFGAGVFVGCVGGLCCVVALIRTGLLCACPSPKRRKRL